VDTRIDKFAKGFFWTGYVVFLSASIPHIAAYFRHFDPITPNWYEDKAYWLIAVAIAIVIDVSDVLVSIAVMRAKASGAKFKDTFGFWVFIVFITALSWLINWQYNVVFGTSQFHVVDQYSFFGRFTIGQINPVLGSAFQVLLLVYTAMAHKFSQKPQTADELQKELERLEALETVQNRLKEYRERNRKKSLIQTAKETLIEAKEAVIELKNGSDEELVSSPETEVLDSPNMEVLTELTGELEEEVFLEENGSGSFERRSVPSKRKFPLPKEFHQREDCEEEIIHYSGSCKGTRLHSETCKEPTKRGSPHYR
jgi:hypothetical protein